MMIKMIYLYAKIQYLKNIFLYSFTIGSCLILQIFYFTCYIIYIIYKILLYIIVLYKITRNKKENQTYI